MSQPIELEARMAKTAAKNTTPAARKPAAKTPKKSAVPSIVIQHAESLESDNIDAMLADLMGEGTPTVSVSAAPDEIIEAAPPADDMVVLDAAVPVLSVEPAFDADALLAELGGEADQPAALDVHLTEEEVNHTLHRVAAVQASIDAATPTGIESDAAPTGEGSDAPPATTDDSAAAAPARTPRRHYSDKVERIKDRLGAGAADYTVLTLADAEDVSEEKLKQVMDDTFEIIRGMNQKEKNRASLLFDFLSGKKATLNNVLETTLKVLHRDGHVTMGKTSNLIAELLGKPYSMGSARAMGGNTVGMYRDLLLLKEDGKGRFVANPESTLLAAANAKLGLVAESV
jgi:hypothetical protein